jgi:uncharacterized protein (TIGR02231 family)
MVNKDYLRGPMLYFMYIFFLLFLSALTQNISSESARNDEREVGSIPVSVTVYPDRAFITRVSKLHIDKGLQSVKIVRLPLDLVKESVRVGVDASASVKILSSDLSTNYQANAPENEIAQLQKQLDSLNEKKQILNDKIDNLEKEKRLLESIQVKTIADKNKEISIGKFVIEDWSKLMEFYSVNLNRIDSLKRDISRQLSDVQEKIASLQNQIGKNRSLKTGTNQLQVTIDAEKESDITIRTSYLVNNVSWTPYYEIHTSDGKSIELQYMASIRQNTGEDWNNISIILTTSRPALGIDLPPAEPLLITRYQPQYYPKSKSSARSGYGAPASERKESMDFAGESVEEYSSAEPAEYVTARIEQDFTSATFQIAKRSNIASGNSSHDVMIVREKLDAEISHKALPYLHETVFTAAKIKNKMTYPLLSGKVNLFINNNFTGSAVLKNIAPEESFSIPLGPDENIKVKYVKVKQSSDIYGLGRKNKKTFYEYRIEIENLKNFAVILNVNDRIPVSGEAEIKVELKDINPKNDNDIQKDRGVILWRLPLKAKEKKIINFSYTVDHPEDYIIKGISKN